MFDATVVISVYNKVRELELVLSGLKIQTVKNFEIIIADDGSADEMKKFISGYNSSSSLSINHVWQEDDGFRKNKILNESIRQAKAHYMIFIDGDCIPHSDFVNSHLQNKEKDAVLGGRRVYLGERVSESLTPELIEKKYLERKNITVYIDNFLKKKTSTYALEEGLLIKNKMVRDTILRKDIHLLGSNFSLHRDALIKINGFDENYIGPGIGEDTDIEFRLRKAGYKMKSVRNLAIQYHLYHPKTKEEHKNLKYFNEEVKQRDDFMCQNGLTKTA
ncbi:MAG TPA: glycosyltransferase [Ignavibacteria bacterium]|nr:glycosyltransferase [Ignavibacteria bacterium]